jgi:hypothetical protein
MSPDSSPVPCYPRPVIRERAQGEGQFAVSLPPSQSVPSRRNSPVPRYPRRGGSPTSWVNFLSKHSVPTHRTEPVQSTLSCTSATSLGFLSVTVIHCSFLGRAAKSQGKSDPHSLYYKRCASPRPSFHAPRNKLRTKQNLASRPRRHLPPGNDSHPLYLTVHRRQRSRFSSARTARRPHVSLDLSSSSHSSGGSPPSAARRFNSFQTPSLTDASHDPYDGQPQAFT